VLCEGGEAAVKLGAAREGSGARLLIMSEVATGNGSNRPSRKGGVLTEAPSISDVTLAEYNRWVVERENKQVAEERRADMERERQVRAKMDEEWRQRGLARFRANKDQVSISKASVETLQKSNLAQGAKVKDEKQQWSQQRKVENDQFLEKSQQHVRDLGSDLRTKVAEEKKNMTERNRQLFNDVKAELKAYQDIREDRNSQFIATQKQRRDEIRDMCKTAVRDAKDDKGFAADKKKTGDATRAQVKIWRDQKQAAHEAHQQSTVKHKEGIAASKAAAKSARNNLEQKRRQEALEIRNYKTKLASENADLSKEQEKLNRVKHNEIRDGRFVPAEMAKAVKDDTTFTDAIRYANERHQS